MQTDKFIEKNLNFISINLEKKNYFLNKKFFKNLISKKKIIKKKIYNNYKNKKIKKSNIKINFFINFFIKIYKKYEKINENKINNFINNLPNLTNKKVPNINNIIVKISKNKKIKKNKINYKNINYKLGIDFDLGNKISGHSFCIIKNPISYLYKALIKFMLKIHIKEHNYKEIVIPYIIKLDNIIKSGQIPKFINKVYKIENENKYLIPTSEVILINFIYKKTIESNKIPIYITSLSPCFRKEKKCYGKENKGLIRQKQFEKIELVRFCEQKNSYNNLKEMIKNSEKILKKLKIPYRIVLLSKKNISILSSKTYDIEIWMPNLNNYCEISSCTNTESFQSYKTQSKYINKKKKKNLHILNASGLAVGRTLEGVIENYNKKNFIKIPKILTKYMNKKKFIKY